NAFSSDKHQILITTLINESVNELIITIYNVIKFIMRCDL
ncbi:hypothetical protein ACJ72_08493, partial [Emergomyces africanus]